MEEYNVTFVHPTTGATLTAQINPNLTADEVINALVAENFIERPDSQHNYVLGITGGSKVEGSQSLASGGLRDGSTVNVVSSDVAGLM